MIQMNETIGFVGLGALGHPIAHNLLKAGYHLKVYNRTTSKAEPLKALGAEIASRPADTLTPGGTIVTVVSNDEALEEVVMREALVMVKKSGGDPTHEKSSHPSPHYMPPVFTGSAAGTTITSAP
jgi:3-hydroxyisobutyrate dehydrogenase-like beta-hydroxyacid dehydrogenase